MSKISLKNILKKTFKKKSKKITKSKTKKISKKVKTKKSDIKKFLKKSLTKKTDIKKKKITSKTENLRIPKSNEIKPEIKKIKKQESEKRQYKVKEHVVYPKHGVGVIKEFKKITIGGIDVECYIIDISKEKLELKFPVNKQSLLRPLSTINQVNKCISILKGKPKIKRSMWSRRAQEYEAKISSGKIYELAEVIRDLNKGDDLMVDQSYSERQLFEKAYERMLTEFQIILNISLEDTQKKLDKALKRNQDNQNKTEVKPQKASSNDLQNEEPLSEQEENLET